MGGWPGFGYASMGTNWATEPPYDATPSRTWSLGSQKLSHTTETPAQSAWATPSGRPRPNWKAHSQTELLHHWMR
eukprot:6308889-Pyramimonas_sp.AAC.1